VSAPEPVNPGSLGAPRGYSHGMLAPAGGRLLAVAGQIAWDERQEIVAGGFPEQFGQALANVLAVVREAGGGPEHVAQLTLFVTDKDDYLASLREVGEVYRRLMGRHYPAMALVEVAALLEPGARVEIQGLAVVPPGARG
jgi:enamine deaminase RidA (YjgF/YER057c/UK114 family)